jgi:hypothetical protein
MKALLTQYQTLFCVALCQLCCGAAIADSLVLQTRTVSGTVLQTNGDSVLLLTDYGTLNYSLGIIKEIKIDRAEAVEFASTGRLPDSRSLVLFLSRQSWAQNLKQIPATVIDKGSLRNVPYNSYRCSDAYEVNVYGEPNDPAGIEAGVDGKLVGDQQARRNCLSLVRGILSRSADKETLDSLKLEQDLKTNDGFTFEITPPTAEDSYGGWWVSVYSEQKLNLSRASESELKNISVTKLDAIKDTSDAGWSAEELKLARKPAPTLISFTTDDGRFIEDAEVVHVNEGVSLIWRKGASGGTVKLANLPESLRRRFGYDPAKTASAEEADKAKKRQTAAEIQAAQSAQAIQPSSSVAYSSSYASGGGGGSSAYSGGGSGRVYVHSYQRRDGTYVSGYTRRR